MATEVIKSPNNVCTLYELEDHLQALANSIDMAEDEFSRDLATHFVCAENVCH